MFPFAAPQALWVRRTAARFAAATGPLGGAVGEGPPLRLLASGDSIIAGVGAALVEEALVWQTSRCLAERLGREVQWTARGQIGARSSTLWPLLPQAHDTPFDIVLLSVGVNDITSLTRQSRWRNNLQRVLQHITRHSADAVVAVAGIPPLDAFPLLPQPLRFAAGQRGKAFDRTLSEVVAEFPQVLRVPVTLESEPGRFSADGFHPSAASYRDFAQGFAEDIAAARQARD